MIEVFGPKGGRTTRVLWALTELGINYTHTIVMPRSDEIRAVNPLGQAPAMRDGEAILTDSWAILNYFADRAEALTYPTGTPERARMEARINFALTEMEAPLWLMARHKFVLPKEDRIDGMREVAEADFARGEAKAAMLLGDDEFFGGDRFTIADIIVTHIANWADTAKIALQEPGFAAYFERMKARDAWQQVQKYIAEG